jgi:apoptosis-inducing factor 3
MQPIEKIVATVDDLQDGEKRQVKVGETEVLLARIDGTFYATGAFCTHYQAPLAEGILSGEQIVCPWHTAHFNLKTGQQQEPPGLDSLSCYAVRIDGKNVIVQVPADPTGQQTPAMAAYDPNQDSRTFVILGAGAAGVHAAETLRVAGYQGRVIMVTADDRLPYDCTWLSKDYLTGKVSAEKMPLRSAEFYGEHDIEIWLSKPATQVNTATKTIAFQDGEQLSYDALLVAVGGRPRSLEVPGATLENVLTLRSFDDADRILAAAKQATHAIVVGSSFIGMEAAAGLTQQGVKVTVVSPDSLPFQKILGDQIGQAFQQVHQENGVGFQWQRQIDRIEGNGKVEAVTLNDGTRLAADLVVVGVGVQPATELLEGVALHPQDKSVVVDQYLHAAEDFYAAGDIARYPDDRTHELMRVEHWRVAAQQGRIAAYNMVGQPTPFKTVPIFWTMQFGFPLRYVGHAEQWDEVIVDGNLHGSAADRQFIVFYVKDNRVLAAATSKRDAETAALTELLRLDRMPSPDQLRDGKINLLEYLDKAIAPAPRPPVTKSDRLN